MAGESVHDKLGRVRAPRVHITYQVETGGAMVMKELPFVMGVLGDFTSNPKETDKKLKERDFVEVNMQNFDKVLKEMAPTLSFTAQNKLSSDPSTTHLRSTTLNVWAQGRRPNTRRRLGPRPPPQHPPLSGPKAAAALTTGRLPNTRRRLGPRPPPQQPPTSGPKVWAWVFPLCIRGPNSHRVPILPFLSLAKSASQIVAENVIPRGRRW